MDVVSLPAESFINLTLPAQPQKGFGNGMRTECTSKFDLTFVFCLKFMLRFFLNNPPQILQYFFCSGFVLDEYFQFYSQSVNMLRSGNTKRQGNWVMTAPLPRGCPRAVYWPPAVLCRRPEVHRLAPRGPPPGPTALPHAPGAATANCHPTLPLILLPYSVGMYRVGCLGLSMSHRLRRGGGVHHSNAVRPLPMSRCHPPFTCKRLPAYYLNLPPPPGLMGSGLVS